jgi:hypothetical protein
VSSALASRRKPILTEPILPPSDSPGGAAVAVAAFLAIVYALLLVGLYSAMLATAWWIVSLSLVVGVVGTFSLGTMLGTDIATFQRLDLDLARTVTSHRRSNDAPPPEAALAGIWRAYITVADESRRVARVHAYSFGPFFAGTLLSLGAALLVGLGTITGTPDAIGLGAAVELPAFAFLVLAGLVLALTVGYSDTIHGLDRWAPRRWRRNSARLPAIEEALTSVPWLPEFHRGVRESRPAPEDSTLHWITP